MASRGLIRASLEQGYCRLEEKADVEQCQRLNILSKESLCHGFISVTQPSLRAGAGSLSQ